MSHLGCALIGERSRILAAARERLGEQLVTLHVCQGKYAHAEEYHLYPAPDMEVGAIANLRALGPHDFRPSQRSRR